MQPSKIVSGDDFLRNADQPRKRSLRDREQKNYDETKRRSRDLTAEEAKMLNLLSQEAKQEKKAKEESEKMEFEVKIEELNKIHELEKKLETSENEISDLKLILKEKEDELEKQWQFFSHQAFALEREIEASQNTLNDIGIALDTKQKEIDLLTSDVSQKQRYEEQVNELTQKLATTKLKHDKLMKEKINMDKKLERRVVAPNIPRKPYSELTLNGKKEAQNKLKRIMNESFYGYEIEEIIEMFKNAYPQLISHPQFDEKRTLMLQRDVKITDRGMDRLRKLLKSPLGFDVFAPRAEIIKYRKTIIKTCDFESFEAGGIIGARIVDVKSAIINRVNLQKKSNNYFPDNPNGDLELCLVADKGGDHTIFGITFGSLKKRHSPDAFLLLGIFKGDENRDNLKTAFNDIARQLGEINNIEINGLLIKVFWFLTGDLKLLKSILGLRYGNSTNPCIFCIEPAEKNFSAFKPELYPSRNYTFVNKYVCQDFKSIFPFVPCNYVVPPGLHQFLGIVGNLIKVISNELRKMEFNQNNEDTPALELENVSVNLYEDDISQDLIEESEASKNEKEKLQKLINSSNEIQNLTREWENYSENVNAEHPIRYDIESEFDYLDDDPNNGPIDGTCAASNCIVKLTGLPLPDRIAHGVKKTISIFQCKDTKKFYHSICCGMNGEAARAQKKKQFIGTEVSKEAILAAISNEVTDGNMKIIEIKEKIEKEFYKDMPSEEKSVFVRKLEKVFESFRAYKQPYYQAYNGVHTRRILINASSILTSLRLAGIEEADQNGRIVSCCEALILLSKIQDKSVARRLSDDEINELKENIRNLEVHMKSKLPQVSVTQKFHILLKHVPPFVDRWRTFNYFSEQIIEHMHSVIKQWLRRIATHDEKKLCLLVMSWSWEKNICFDEKESLPNEEVRGLADSQFL